MWWDKKQHNVKVTINEEPPKTEFSIVGGELKPTTVFSMYGDEQTGIFNQVGGVWVWTPLPRRSFCLDMDLFEDYQSQHLEAIAAKLRELNAKPQS